MAVAAATAVIAPAAFLAAPAAYATDGNNGTTTSDSTSKTPAEGTNPSTENDTETPAETEKSEKSEESSEGDAKTETGTETGGESQNDTPASEAEGEKKPEGEGEGEKKEDDKTSETSEGEGDAKPEDEEGEEEPPPYCWELDENFEQDALSADVSGLPGKIVAGSGWHNFSLTITNQSKVTLREVAFYAEVDNWEVDDEAKSLRKFVDLEFRDPATNEWINIDEAVEYSFYFWGVEGMKAGEFVKADLRVKITKDAPLGDGYSFGAGGYLGDVNGQDCIAEDHEGDSAFFEVLKPGSSNENPGEAKPGTDNGKPNPKPGPDTKPQGEVKQYPVTGSLAETGSNSMLPTIGIAGGIAVVAGAGVVFALKRRGNGATA
ncbi:LPXTG cell wall anchor domain-containing protein [Streptomyces sp. PR69]|uniref:LPXTG cell wall anchor domain-containing protein n=1 Tax=Streptomyces sp. PR69 TaxID=2984950 RepID=UPI00226429E1|nr:LPXTG cell wall anchor domain-containing protein [Streptomyces sp. PR69]